MFAVDCKIRSNEKIAEGIYEIVIQAEAIAKVAKPGQFVNIAINKTIEPLLRRPISISSIEEDCLFLVYQVVGKGTELLTHKRGGEILNLLGPSGNGFPVKKEAKAAVLGGGIGTAPLLELTKHLSQCDAYLGFRSEPYQIEKFEKHCTQVIIATEDGSVGEKGYIIDHIENIKDYDVVYACGPKIFLQKVKERCAENQVPCYVSLEERMGCGIGACLVCNCKIQGEKDWDYKRVCKDGPVFDAKDVILYE